MRKKTTAARIGPATTLPFPTRALAQLTMSNGAHGIGQMLLIADRHVDAFLGTDDDGENASIGRLDDTIKAICAEHDAGLDGTSPRYVEVEHATRESDLRLDVGAHRDVFLSDITCTLRTGAMQAGFALGLALGLRMMGGAR
jgi:hypothetical protein